jgi:hypothetical protein
VDARGDQYRTSISNAPGTTPVEYMFWADNTSNLALVDDLTWWTDTGAGTIPQGTLTVTDNDPDPLPAGQPAPPGYGTRTDGTLNVVVKDEGFRSIGSILFLVVARGDESGYDDAGWTDSEDPTKGREGSRPYLVVQLQGGDSDAAAGLATVTDSNLFTATSGSLIATTVAASLEGGLSQLRGDSIRDARYTVAAPRFFWTRNDRYQLRFGWDGANQRWGPYKGAHTLNLGRLSFDEQYQLDPKPRGLKIGFTLPGDGFTADSYSMIRLGSAPSFTSTAVAPDGTFSGVGVRSDKQVEEGFDFSTEPSLAGVVGMTNGLLVFNPAYIEQHAGKDIWYANRDFNPDSDGIVGELGQGDLYLSPIPGPADRPLLRVGSRLYLSPVLTPGEDGPGGLGELVVAEGQVGVSLSTGKIKFSAGLLAKADPDHQDFNKHYLGSKVVYDGVSLSGRPQASTEPVQVIEANGKLYIPNAETLPLAISGILDAPDGTGAIPGGAGEADVRPGGDTFAASTKGRIRQVVDGVSDTMVFTRKGAMSVIVVDLEADLPTDKHKIPKGVCYIAREYSDATGSVLKIGRADLKDKGSDPAYFLQSSLTPAAFTAEAKLFSKTRFVFRFDGGETLYFDIEGNSYQWDSNTLLAALPDNEFFTPEEVAASIQLAIDAGPGVGSATTLNGSVVLAADSAVGMVEIGWGGDPKDLSGAEKLGFLPGWRVVGGSDNWVVDSGVSLGLYRSPRNLQRVTGVPDFKAYSRVEDVILQGSVQPAPFVFFQNPPIQDIAGYDEGVFFNIVTVIEDPDGVLIVNKPLEHYEDILHDFAERRFLWLDAGSLSTPFQQPVTTIGLGQPSVAGNSLLNAPGIGGGLLISDGGAFEFQELDTDYLLPQDGISGNVVLIRRYGDGVLSGGRGTYTVGGAFQDPEANFLAPSEEQALDGDGNPLFSGGQPVYLPVAQEGYRIKLLSGEEAGSYLITSVNSATELAVDPPFLGDALRSTPWEMYRGFTAEVYDPAVVADQVYLNFNHLPEEPFKVNVLTPLGTPDVTLAASVEGAVSRGRATSIRYGLAHEDNTNSADLVALTRATLGIVANGLLVVPDAGSTRFTSVAYSLRVGADKLTPIPVAVFSSPQDPDTVEVDPSGNLQFGGNLLADYAKATVTYQEEFLGATDVAAGAVEYNPDTGDLNIGTADQAAHAGKVVYFTERMISENTLDVSMNPLAGAIGFQQPLQEGQSVEVCYHQADLEGRKEGELIQEFLPVFVTKAEATRVNHFTFTFNNDGRNVDTRIAPTVFIGAMIQNFQVQDYVLEAPADPTQPFTIQFLSKVIPDHVTVKVSFAAFEANGGERSYTVSTTPVYRPPFFLKAGADSFGLQGDRTGDFLPGQIIRLGAECFYVREVEYFPTRVTPLEEKNPLNPAKPIVKAGNVTKIHLFPSTVREVGSRAPGHDVLTVISAGALTTVVDPEGASPTATGAPAGFMQEVPLTEFPFEPVNRGQKTVNFRGDLTTFAVPGHIMEVGGYPFTISGSELNPEGTYTKITLTAPFRTGVSMDTVTSVKLSYRPVYPPSVRSFLPLGPMVSTEPFELVLFGEQDASGAALAGRTLTPSVEYSLDPASGSIELLEPNQAPLGAGQRLVLSHTRNRTLSPSIRDGVVNEPRAFATYLYNTIPDGENGLEGALLQATYTFRSPDTFYFRIPTLTQFLAEAIQEAVEDIQAQQTGNGPMVISTPGEDNWDQGSTGLIWERRHLMDKDRASRTFLDFYNQAIVAFEQINETIDGRFVGDRDGKFRFFIGKGLEWPTPGYEDEISGHLLPKNLWSMVVNEANPANDLIFLEADPLVEPTSATLAGGVLAGVFPTADRLQQLIARQAVLVTNDVDDLVVTSKQRPTVKFLPVSPFFSIQALADFKRMADSHALSRIYPTQAKAFFLTFPGIGADEATGDPGSYTWGRTVDGERKSTNQSEIASVSNPVLGGITNISESALTPRRARARVWGYFPDGLAANVFGAVPPAAILEPCMIVVQTPLSEVPVHPDTGFVDVSKLRSQGGEIADAEAGDPELALPGFAPGDQLSWGQPDGSLYQAHSQKSFTVFGIPLLDSLHVLDVQYGCVVRFADSQGSLLDDPSRILVGTGAASGTPLQDFPLSQGDTILVIPSLGQGVEISDPPTISELRAMGSSIDVYRNGFDLSIRPDGRVLDQTLPSFNDPHPYGLKEIFGQKAPDPLSGIEGPVEFVYANPLPLEIPALLGQVTDDDGDYSIPYLRTGNTELDRLGDPTLMSNLFGVFSQNGGLYTYPDEIVALDGEVIDTHDGINHDFSDVGDPFGSGGATKEAGVIMTLQDPFPVGVGQESLEPFDLLLVECGQSGINAGAQGLLNVGAVRQEAGGVGFIEPPRFITPTTAPAVAGGPTGSPVRYVLDNALVHVDGYLGNDPTVDQPSGVRLYEYDQSGDAALDTTVLSFVDLGSIALNDGVAAAAGNLNDIWGAAGSKANNRITLRCWARDDVGVVDTPGANPMAAPGTELFSIEIQGLNVTITDTVSGNAPTTVVVTNVEFGTNDPAPLGSPAANKHIVITGFGIGGHIWPGPTPAQWFVPYVETNLAAPGYKRETVYSYDFSVDVDTYNNAAPRGESDTAYVAGDRLTFHEVLDFRLSRQRGSTHPQAAGTVLETRLLVEEVTCAPNTASSVNRINGGDPLTFIGRTAADVGNELASGAWSSPAGGSLKAVALEGHLNVNLPGTDVRFAGVPSSPNGPSGVICQGSGLMESKANGDIPAAVALLSDDRVTEPVVSAGLVGQVEPGDILTIKKSGDAAHDACTKAGTYLVKHAIAENDALSHTLQTTQTCVVGGGNGWIMQTFPEVVRFDGSTLTVTSTSGFPGVGNRVFICRDLSKLTAATAAEYATAFWSGAVTGMTLTTFTLNNLLDATGAPALLGDLEPWVGLPVAGLDSLVVGVRGGDLPDSWSVVGHHDLTLGSEVIHGVRLINFEGAAGPGAPVLYDATAGEITVPGGGGQVEVDEGTPINNTLYNPDEDPVVYDHVPVAINIANVPDADWATLNDPNGHSAAPQWVAALLPNTEVTLGDPVGPTSGFWAQAGIFLEPSFPTPVEQYDAGQANVVEQGAAAYANIGARDFAAFNTSGVAVTTPEPVEFEVRRIRRFHGLLDDISAQFAPLRFAYEIRRGRITQYTATAKQFGLVEANGFDMDFNNDWGAAPLAPDVWNTGEVGLIGTNLGPFDNLDVNINAGDLFRLLDEDGNLLEQVAIVGATSSSEVKLEAPGLQTPKATLESNSGMRFEIWLRQAPVPHEQSNEQLLELVTFKTVTETKADYATETGGYVNQITVDYDSVVNRMSDDANPGTWGGKGVQRGDIVVVDPTPTISQTGERGSRPIGDIGAFLSSGPQRAGHSAGEPNSLDDNRGFYRVVDIDDSVSPAVLVVDGLNTLAGARISGATSDVVFPEDPTFQATLGYSIMPTISGSVLTPDSREGQMDLRPTKKRENIAGADTYTGDTHSIRPFGYRIIRPSQLFSEDAVDLVLMNRERILSWIQELRVIMSGNKSGTYWVFQDEQHCRDIGSPSDPIDGLGVLGNVTVESLIGETNTSPFMNTSDCLSILDRRFWILDRRLDSLVPDSNIGYRTFDSGADPAFPLAGGPYTAYSDTSGEAVRPVLPERVDIIQDTEDQLRPARYAWLAYRTNTIQGTLRRIELFDQDLPKRLAEAERAARLEEAAENA